MEHVHERRIAAAAGEALESASVAVVMIHGRGDSARGILQLASYFALQGVAYLAPEATGGSWYPNTFLAPVEQNEPMLSSALATVGSVLDEVERAGVPRERTVLLGFSQGACLASEFAARNGGAFGGVVALSGGLIGPPGSEFEFATSLQGTTAFLGCSDIDAHIPVERVHETASVLQALGADVEKRIYPGMAHTVNEDEVEFVADLLRRLLN